MRPGEDSVKARPADRVGLLNRAARIAHVAHGGQVLLSETTTALVRDELPPGVSLLDLGRHLLTDIHRPERICQLAIEGLSAEFPPLASLEALPPEYARPSRKVGTCPYRGLSAFQEPDAPFYFGREAFIDTLERAVRAKKLVAVIVGCSGSGKSSALFAGLIPRLRKAGGYLFASFRPGGQAFYSLATGALRCTIRNIGDWAVRVEGGPGHAVADCDLFDTGDGGVSLSGGDRQTLAPGGHFVENCHFARQGRWSKCYVPAVLLSGVGLRAAHNLIHDHPHCAILFGGNEHSIEFNEIHHIALETGDVGAIYTGRDWTCRGNRIRHNFIHHTGGVGMGSMGVYMDDCVSGTEVYGNVFYKVHWAMFIGGGRDHRVENNLFVDCDPAVRMDGRGLDRSPVWFNMVYDTMKNTSTGTVCSGINIQPDVCVRPSDKGRPSRTVFTCWASEMKCRSRLCSSASLPPSAGRPNSTAIAA